MGDSADNAPMKWTLTGAAALLIAGCSPALNWRTVPLPEAELTITLPCKPDQATRTVELAGAPVELSMVGCDADGATFAVSHAALADPAQVGAALTQRTSRARLAILGYLLPMHNPVRVAEEYVMLDVMFDIPSRDDVVACHVAAATIRKEAPPELVYGKPEKRRALKEPAASKKKPRTA